jgi:hypothetical protein
LTSNALRVRRLPSGVLVEGEGRLAFCPCLGTPIALRFTSATLAPPHDIIVGNPVVEVFGAPVAWAPAWWLRSAGRFGVLAPDVAWRGSDGFRVGEGVHVPWTAGDREQGLDLRASSYVRGGLLLDTRLRTTHTDTQIQWDRLLGDDGLVVATRGAMELGRGSRTPLIAWEADALRGDRAVRSTSDINAASRPFDRTQATTSWRGDETLWVSGVRSVARRGGALGNFGAGGPFVAVRRSDAIGRLGTYDAALEAGVTEVANRLTTTFARAETDALLVGDSGPVATVLSLRGLATAADDGIVRVLAGTAQARAVVGVPFGREFPSPNGSDPWLHLTEPAIEAAVLATDPGTAPLTVPDRGLSAPSGGAWVSAASWKNALSQWGTRESLGLDVSLGAMGTPEHTTPMVRGHMAAHQRWAGGEGDYGRVFDGSGAGGAFIGRLRVGPQSGLNVTIHLAERDGVDPVAARVLVDPLLEPATGFLAASGWSGGALATAPLGTRLSVRAGAQADLVRRTLVASTGSVEIHDSCRCVVVRLTGSQRLGREGVDVWLSVDLAH